MLSFVLVLKKLVWASFYVDYLVKDNVGLGYNKENNTF